MSILEFFKNFYDTKNPAGILIAIMAFYSIVLVGIFHVELGGALKFLKIAFLRALSLKKAPESEREET